MTMKNVDAAKPEAHWRTWMNKFNAYAEAMEMSYDELQDRRIDRLEAEIVRLRSELAMISSNIE